MELFHTIAILITLAAVFSFLNYRYIKAPTTIGLMMITLLLSVGTIIIEKTGIHTGLTTLVTHIDFNETLMVGMLSFLLFAGALHVNINDLFENKLEIGIFATIGVIFSTLIVGTSFKLIFQVFHLDVPYINCLLFGALISPTDPIAVLGILKTSGASKDLEVKISGESLFNDGIGVVVFIVLLGLATGQQEFAVGNITLLFLKEVIGGIFLGLTLGWIAFEALKRVDKYDVEVLITLALVAGGYALALHLHTSGPITMVVAGLMIGNQGRRLAMSEKTRNHLDNFWELIDEILNAILFVLIGLEVLVISLKGKFLLMGVIAIFLVLGARFCCIGVPVFLLKKIRKFSPNTVSILTWGGLRGGISVALALSLPAGLNRDLLLTMTYLVVVFSLIVQGLTLKRFLKQT